MPICSREWLERTKSEIATQKELAMTELKADRHALLTRPFHGGIQLPLGEAQHSPPSREGP